MRSRPKQLRWGIVGTGQAAAQFAQGLHFLPEASPYAVASRQLIKSDLFATAHKISHAYPSYESMFEDPDIDIIYVATPPALHAQHCLQAIEKGKHVVCEKPFTTTTDEARKVVSAAQNRGVFCMEAMWMRFIPLVQEAVKKIREGVIGEIRMLSASLGHQVITPKEHHLFNANLGGGALMDLGVYPLSLAYQLLGKPKEIKSERTIGKTGVDEQTTIILCYDQGQQASIGCSLQTQMNNECLIMGTKGILRIHAPLYRPSKMSIIMHNPIEMTSSQHVSWLKQIPGLTTAARIKRRLFDRAKTTKKGYWGNGYQYEAAEAMRCVHHGHLESQIMSHNDTVGVMQILDEVRNT